MSKHRDPKKTIFSKSSKNGKIQEYKLGAAAGNARLQSAKVTGELAAAAKQSKAKQSLQFSCS